MGAERASCSFDLAQQHLSGAAAQFVEARADGCQRRLAKLREIEIIEANHSQVGRHLVAGGMEHLQSADRITIRPSDNRGTRHAEL
jgi:hypothetical protein